MNNLIIYRQNSAFRQLKRNLFDEWIATFDE